MSTKFLEGYDYLPVGNDAAFNEMVVADGYWGHWTGYGQGIGLATGRFGLGRCLVLGDPPGGVFASRPLNWVFNDGFVWGIAILQPPGTQGPTITLRDSQAEVEIFRIEFPGAGAAGILRFISSFGTTRTRTGTVKANTWFYMQIKYVGNTFQVKINGDVVINLTSIASCPSFDSMALGNAYAQGALFLDDIYMNDPVDGATNHDYLGNIVVRAQTAIAAGDLTQLTANGASFNWQIAGNNVLDVTKYNYTPDVGDADLYQMNPNVAARDVLALQLKGFYMQDDGVQLFGQNQLKTGGTVYGGSPLGLNQTNYGSITDYWDRNPDTGDFWTTAELNAPIQAGPKLQASD